MKNKLLLLPVFCTLLFFNRCGSNKVVPNICFAKDVLPIFVSKCGMSGCHNGNTNRNGRRLSDLTTYDGIISRVSANHPLSSDVYTKCNGSNPSMPPSPNAHLSSAELDYIKYWIHTGAKNNNCANSGCDSSNVTYSSKVQPLIQNWCTGCHNANQAGGGYDFSGYEGLKNAITAGRLMGCINQQQGYSAMPQGSKLDACDIGLIQKWVNNGYSNN